MKNILKKVYQTFVDKKPRITAEETSGQIDLEQIRIEAESYYRNGDYYCSEAIVKTIKDRLDLDITDDAIAMASGFPVGVGGSGCLCGAVNGGIMILGLIFGRSKPGDKRVDKAMALAKELQEIFKKRHQTTCCRVLTKDMKLGSSEHMEQCIFFTGEMAVETVKIIGRELEIEYS